MILSFGDGIKIDIITINMENDGQNQLAKKIETLLAILNLETST